MKRTLLFIPILALVFACSQKKMTLEELKKAKWTNLTPGIDYISTQKGGAASVQDSFELKLRGIQEAGLILEAFMENEYPVMPGLLTKALKESSLRSKAGYLKINLTEMIKPPDLEGQVYLRGDYTDPFSFSKDSATLMSIEGIRSIAFISKDSAMKIYMAEESQDWSRILDENPLPNAIKIKLENKKWTKELLSELDSIITGRIPMASEFVYPGILFEKSDTWYYFEYKRM